MTTKVWIIECDRCHRHFDALVETYNVGDEEDVCSNCSEFMAEEIEQPQLEVGDTVLTGKYRNVPETIEGQTTDDHGQPVLLTKKEKGGHVTKERKMYPYRIEKLSAESLAVGGWSPMWLVGLAGVAWVIWSGRNAS